MIQAFNSNSGPLTDMTEPEAERKALMFLVAGAMGRFKNPSGHRHVNFSSPKEAIEMILLANHLFKIVEERTNS